MCVTDGIGDRVESTGLSIVELTDNLFKQLLSNAQVSFGDS